VTFQELLSGSEIEQIHRTSMGLMARTGVVFPDAEAIAIFRKHGVRTDGSTVYLEERQVLQALSTAPASFTIAARNPARSVTVGGGEPVFVPGYGAPFLVDLEAGRRAAGMDDYHNLARLAHALPNQDMSGYLLVEPDGVPGSTAQQAVRRQRSGVARSRGHHGHGLYPLWPGVRREAGDHCPDQQPQPAGLLY